MKTKLISFLKQGLSPERLALCIALGIVVGVIPVLGSTTILLTLIALGLRLNLAAIQSVNWLVYPLQIGLLIPWYRAGEKLFKADPIGLSLAEIKTIFDAGLLSAIQTLWTTTWHALAAWALAAPILIVLIYIVLTPLFQRLSILQGEESAR